MKTNNMTEILTTTLNNGQTCLAKLYQGKPTAVSYANMKQANTRIDKLRAEGIDCFRTVSFPYYIIIAGVIHAEQRY